MDARKMIADAGAVLEGDFFFALAKEGNVSTKYINLDPVLTHRTLVDLLGSMLVTLEERNVCEVIATPAVGAIPLGYAAARVLTLKEARVVWADKKDGAFVFERMGFAATVRGKRVHVVEDISSSGSSAKAVCDLVRDAGGHLTGASLVWNRGNVTAEMLGVPKLIGLVNESVQVWKAGEHPHWGEWPLVEDVGHPEHFPNYPGPRITLQDTEPPGRVVQIIG